MKGDKSYKVISIAIISIAVMLTLYTTYKDFLYAYFEILKTENYNYIIVVVPLSIAILIKLIINEFDVEGINFFRLIASITLILFSVLFNVIGDIVNEFYIEFKALSIICIVWSLLTVFFRPRSIATACLALALLLVIIPIPRPFIDYISSMLTRVVTMMVASITSTVYIDREGFLTIVVQDFLGRNHLLEIAPICSGITSILSVSALAPLIIYFALKSSYPLYRKLVFTVTSFVTAISTVFLGNLLRLILIIELVKRGEIDIALGVFHYTPSIIYVVIATSLVIYIASKMLRKITPSISNTMMFVKPSLSYYLAILMCIVLLIAYNVLQLQVSSATLTQFTLPIADLPSLLKNSTELLINPSNKGLIYEVPEPRISMILGVPVVKRILFEYNNTLFTGYIELADTPSKFHGWYVCVTFQGYTIEKSWVEVSNTTIYHMVISKSNTKLLLSYALYRVQLSEGVTYIRLSIMTFITDQNLSEIIEKVRRILCNVQTLSNSRSTINTYILDTLVVSVNTLTVVSTILLLLYVAGKVLENKRVNIIYKVKSRSQTLQTLHL